MKEGGGPRGMTDLVDDVCMEKRGRCWRPQEIPMYHVAESCSECLEITMDGRIKRIGECGMEEQKHGFRRGRATMDAMFNW